MSDTNIHAIPLSRIKNVDASIDFLSRVEAEVVCSDFPEINEKLKRLAEINIERRAIMNSIRNL